MTSRPEIKNALHIVPRIEIGADAWDAVVRGSPDGWVFALHDWQNLILDVVEWGIEEHSFALVENGYTVAVVPLQFNPNNGIMASSGWSGAGPIICGTVSGKARVRLIRTAIDHCIETAIRRGASNLDIPLLPVTRTSISAPWGVNPLVYYGLEDISGLSRVVDLSLSQEELWSDMSPDARRQIKLAREKGLLVARANWKQSVDHYYELHCETYNRTGVPPHPKAYFAGIAELMSPSGHAVLWQISNKMGDVIAYHNDAYFGQGAYYHTGCSRSDAADMSAGYLLFWEAMLGAKAEGIRWYDCGAVFPNSDDPKQRGLTTFKTKFGGKDHRLFRGHKSFASAAAELPAKKMPKVRRKLHRLFDSVHR